jgi:NAD(P)-dependent dehydrogenase (short-subunit alcohol dehydrogenase family)
MPSTMTGRLDGRRALVTGGGSGIGRATAERLAAEGAAVGVVDVRAGAAEDVAEKIVAAGGTAVGTVGDVGDQASVDAATAAVVAAFGGLDTVVACAGLAYPGTTDGMSLDAWDTMIRVNLTGVFLTVRAAVPHLLEAGGGAIVTIGSTASLVASGQCSAYDASKGGVLQFTRSVAVEYVEHGIRANCVCPGGMFTNFGVGEGEAFFRERSPEELEMAKTLHPLGLPITPEDCAEAALYLASDLAANVTGVALPIDGGYLAQ